MPIVEVVIPLITFAVALLLGVSIGNLKRRSLAGYFVAIVSLLAALLLTLSIYIALGVELRGA